MPLELQMKFKKESLYKSYLRLNSEWYKKLIRDPDLFNEFKSEMKTKYKLRSIDKINSTLDAFTIISNIFNNMV